MDKNGMAITLYLLVIIVIPWGIAMIMRAEEVNDIDSPLLEYGIMACLFSLNFFVLYLLLPDTIVCPTWEEMRPWYIARFKGW